MVRLAHRAAKEISHDEGLSIWNCRQWGDGQGRAHPARLSHLFEIVKNKLRAFFIREKAQGRLAADADEDRLADFCIATTQGAMLIGQGEKKSAAR